MKSMWCRRLSAILLSFCLLIAGESARAGIIGLDTTLSAWLGQESAVRFSASVELQALLPFVQTQTDMMNSLLRHISFSASLEQASEDSLTTLAIACGGEALGTFNERKTGDAYTLESDLLPNRVLHSQGISAMDLFSGDTALRDAADGFDMYAAIAEAQGCYQALMEACEPLVEKKKANYKIKNIATAKWSQIARLTPEQSEEMLPQLRAVLQSGMDAAHRAELEDVRFGKGFTVALYKLSETGEDVAVYMKGNLVYPDKTTAKFSYQWAFVEKDGERKDTYKYELVKNTKPAASRIVAAELTQALSTQKLYLKGSRDLTVKAAGVTTLQAQKLELSGEHTSGARTLAGSLSEQVKTTKAGETSTTIFTLKPDLSLTPQPNGAVLQGTALTESRVGSTVTTSLLITFGLPADTGTEAPGLYSVSDASAGDTGGILPLGSFLQNAEEDPQNGQSIAAAPQGNSFLVGTPPIGMQRYAAPAGSASVSLDEAGEADVSALRDEAAQTFASRLLSALAQLPQEDLAIFQDGMTESDYDQLLSLLGNP